jgi:hypothetical protein
MRLVLVLSTYLYGVTLEIGDKEVHTERTSESQTGVSLLVAALYLAFV